MIGLFVAFAAVASQVFYEPVALADVVSASDAAVIVDVGADGMRSVEIPVPGPPEKDCGTYAYGVYRVTVVEVVDEPVQGPPLAPGQVINVFLGNTPDLVSLTQAYCLEGISKSPIFSVYEGVPVHPGDRLLVLLRWTPPYGWIETVAGSWVSPKKAKAVKVEPRGAVALPEGEPPDLLCVDDADCPADAPCRHMRCARPAESHPTAE